MDRRWWLWLGVFIASGNLILAAVALFTGDVFLFLLGLCVGLYVALPLWDRREDFRRPQTNQEDK